MVGDVMRSEFDSFYDKQLHTRLGVAYFAVVLIFGLLGLRLWFLQMAEGAKYRKLSEHNYIRIQKIKAPRGLILDTNGQVLAGNRPSFDICLVPQDARELGLVITRLAGLLSLEPLHLKQRMEKSRGRPPFEAIKLKTDVSRDNLGLVLTHRLDLPGVVIEAIPVRYYPHGTLACHLLGHLGEISLRELARDDFSFYAMGDFVGKSGVEQTMERHLKGIDGQYQAEVDAVGYKINTMGRINPVPAHIITLTINLELQKTAEEALGDRPGAVIAIDPRDGRILAMASSPAFDPNLFSRSISSPDWGLLINDPQHPLMNRCTQSLHPPGSTYKLITAAAALEEGVVTPHTSFFCNGSFRCGRRPYRCWKEEGHGMVSLMKGVAESCDVYFYNLGSLLGPDRIATYAKGFGFGTPTKIELEDEKPGLVPTSGWYKARFGIPWQSGDTLSVAIGQGANQITPLQLLMAYAALANGGTLYTPFYVEKIASAEGEPTKRFVPIPRGQVPLSNKNRELLIEALSEVVNSPSGTGWRARLSHIEVAGKTGTAQVVGIGKALRQSTIFKDHAWFVAFAPKNEARIAVVVLVEHGGHGGSAAAPVAKKIISRFCELEEGGHV